MGEYVTVKLPRGVVDELLDPLVGMHGYGSRTEVVKDALRKLEEKYKATAKQQGA